MKLGINHHALALLLAAFCLQSQAHKASDSYLQLDIADRSVTGRWDIALRDLDLIVGLDANQDGQITWGEVRDRTTAISAHALAHLQLDSSTRCELVVTGLNASTHVDGGYAALALSGKCPASQAPIRLHYSLLFDIDRQHRGLATVTQDGTAHSLVFGPDSPEQVLTAPSGWQTLTTFVAEGIHHILIGYDHILFLLSLLLPAVLVWQQGNWQARGRFRDALIDTARTVTAFTLAHSITLALAALDILRLPSDLVESAIALSVIVAAANNLRPFMPGQRWGMAFVFGLVHGFGFASVLSEVGLPRNQLALALGGFNVGVELGQLFIVALALPLAYSLRRGQAYQLGVMRGGSAAIMVVAGYWFCQRAFGLSL